MEVSSRLLFCKKCKNTNRHACASQYSPGVSPYFLCVNCDACNETWFICPIHNRRWNTRNQYAASQHFNDATIDHPLTKQVNNNINSNETDFIDNDSDDNFDMPYDIDVSDHQQRPDVNTFSHMSSNSKNYFALLKQNPNKCPAQFLVHSAFSENAIFTSQYSELFETKFHLQATRLCLSMSHLQHVQLITLFNMLSSCIDYSSIRTNFATTRIPLSMSELNSFYLTRSSSIRKTLPYPKAEEIDNHAFIRLQDVLLHMFAYGTKMEGICPYDNHDYAGTYVGKSNDIDKTPFMQQSINNILDEFPLNGEFKPLILFGTVWSDGFDANNVVHNAPSIWMRTVTIAPPKNNTTSTLHTFVLHMSREGVNHDKINDLFNDELNKLARGTWFYSTLLNRPIFVVFKIHVYTADRPERGKLTYILGHAGVSTKRWMYSAYLPAEDSKKPLQSCNICFQYRVKKAKTNPKFINVYSRRCAQCADWDYDHLNMEILLPVGYPKSCNINSPDPINERKIRNISHLRPLILSFDNIKESARFMFFNMYKKGFNIGQANVYGRSVGLSNECIRDIIIEQAKSLLNQNPDLSNEEILTQFKYPPIWDCPIALNQYIDAPMHLLFQGIVKSIIEMISEWLSGLSYYKHFCHIIHPIMIEISNMNLNWCFLNSFNTSKNYKSTGWIANNYLAFARLMLVFYRYIRSVVPCTEPGLLQCEGMIQSGLCLISFIMSKHNNDPNPLQEYTKLFLSCVDEFYTNVYILNSSTPIWKSRGNFLSLLNLPLQQAYFGNVRYFWEGERERYIQQVKPLLSQLRHSTSFLVTKLERLYQFAAIDYVLQSIPDDVESDILPKKYHRTYDYIIYKDIDAVNQLLVHKKPISGIELSSAIEFDHNQHRFCVIVKDINKSLRCYQFHFQQSQGKIKCGHFYKGVDLFDAEMCSFKIFDSKLLLQEKIKHFVLLIPELESEDNFEYTIVSNEWTYLNQNMILDFTCIQNNLFKEL